MRLVLLATFVSLVLLAMAEAGAVPPARCLQPFKKDNNGIQCLAYIPSFYYDTKRNSCVSFVYGGCGGNENRFGSRDHCEKTCVH